MPTRTGSPATTPGGAPGDLEAAPLGETTSNDQLILRIESAPRA
jgi:hypothetical protein